MVQLEDKHLLQGRPDQPEFTVEIWCGFLFGGPATLGLISADP